MSTRERVVQAVYRAVDDVNQARYKSRQIDKSLDTALLGPAGTIDSMGLVNLIVAAEEHIEQEFGVPVTISEQQTSSPDGHPFTTIGSFVDYLSTLLERNHHG